MNTLVLSLALCSALGASAQMAGEPAVVTPDLSSECRVKVKTSAQAAPAQGQAHRMRTLPAKAMKKAATRASVAVNPTAKINVSAGMKASASSASLSESFEGWDGETLDWLPEGWTRKSLDPTRPIGEQWSISAGGGFLPSPADGNYMIGVNFSMNPSDEWLIAPETAVKAGDILTFYFNLDPLWFYAVDGDHVDWETYEWIKQEEVLTVQVLARVKGTEEWDVIKDYAKEYMGIDFNTLMYMGTGMLDEQTFSLEKYAGKTIELAFRYVGTNGNTVFIDAVSIAPPVLEPKYSAPLCTQYWGLACNAEMSSMTLAMGFYPVYSPITWTNQSVIDGASYVWDYCDPVTAEWVTSTNPYELSVTYLPDYSSESSTINNFFYTPVIRASAPGASDGSYTAANKYFQAGGRPYYKFSDGSDISLGVLPFDLGSEGLTIGTAEPLDFGLPAVPVFGYSESTRQWWTDYTFHGEGSEGDKAEVKAYLNFIYPTEGGAMVVKGLWTNAKGQVSAGATFKAEIIALDENFVQLETPLASAICKGSDVLVAEGGVQNYLTLPFKFETPVVIDNSHVGYVVKISGFNDPANVTYFAPYQSIIPNADGLAMGWVEKDITMDGNTRTSLSPIAYFDFGYGDAYNSFSINLDAYYPHLAGPDETIAIKRGEPVSVKLDSYYPAEELKCEIVGGDNSTAISVKAEGQYDKTVVTVKDDCACESIHEYDLVITAPGVKKTIHFSEKQTGISDIEASHDSPATEIYDLAGRRLSLDADLPAGIYVVRRADGSTAKVCR